MANNVVITAADSPTVVFGSALDNTQTDNFFNLGAATLSMEKAETSTSPACDRQQQDSQSQQLDRPSSACRTPSRWMEARTSTDPHRPRPRRLLHRPRQWRPQQRRRHTTLFDGHGQVGVHSTATAPAGHNTVFIDTLPGGTSTYPSAVRINGDSIGFTNTVSIGDRQHRELGWHGDE